MKVMASAIPPQEMSACRLVTTDSSQSLPRLMIKSLLNVQISIVKIGSAQTLVGLDCQIPVRLTKDLPTVYPVIPPTHFSQRCKQLIQAA